MGLLRARAAGQHDGILLRTKERAVFPADDDPNRLMFDRAIQVHSQSRPTSKRFETRKYTDRKSQPPALLRPKAELDLLDRLRAVDEVPR